MTQDTNPTLTDITGLHGICKIPNLPKIIVNTESKEECEKIIQQILTALDQYPKLKEQNIKDRELFRNLNDIIIKLKAENEELNKEKFESDRIAFRRTEDVIKLQQENNQLKQLIAEIPRIRKELDSIPVEDLLTDHCITIDAATTDLFEIEKILKGDSTS